MTETLDDAVVVDAAADGRPADPTESTITSSGFARWLAAIVGAGVLWQIVFILVWRQDYVVWGDAFFYYESGKLLADGIGWVSPIDYLTTGEIIEAADHPPAYILFLALWSWLGITGVTAQMLLTSLLIGGPLIAVTGLAGREVGGRRLGLIAAAVVAVYPNIWVWEGTLLSEPVAMLGLVLVVWLSYRFWHRPTVAGGVWLGLALTFATFGRAELLLLSVIVVTPLILRTSEWAWGKRLGVLVLTGAVCAASLAPWVAFNLSRFEEPVYLSAGFEITLAASNCDDTFYGPLTGYWSIECYTGFLDEAGLTFENSDQGERADALVEETFQYLGDNADRIPTVLAARWMRITGLWKPIQDASWEAFLYERNLWATQLAQASWYPVAALAIAGAVALRRRRETILPLVGPVVVVVITITITFAQNRYRASVEPAIAILAAVALERLWVGLQRVLHDPDDA